MKMKVYSVFDNKGGNYGTPFFALEDGIAARLFTDLVQDNQSTVNRHPEDFSLFKVGEFDDREGKIKSQLPIHLTSAVSVKRIEEPINIAQMPIDSLGKNNKDKKEVLK